MADSRTLCDPAAVRPEAADIAAPDFPPGVEWINAKRVRIEMLLRAGAVLVHFWDYAQLNSLRTLPYLELWRARYRGAGLRVVGVHSPRYPFTRGAAAVGAAVAQLGISYPVAVDDGLAIWRDYGTEGWPALFLWGRSGTLRWFHFGEGEYRATENAIQELLLEVEPEAELPEPLAPLRPTDAPDAEVLTPTPEQFPGGSVDQPWQPHRAASGLEVEYVGAGAHVAIEGAGPVAVELDGRRFTVDVEGPGLYELAGHGDRHESHRLMLTPSSEQKVYSLSFAPGVRV